MATKTPAPVAPQEELTESDFVYTGQRLLSGAAGGTSIQLIGYEGGTQNIDSAIRVYDGKHGRKWIIGGIYTGAKFSATSSLGLPSARYVRMYGAFVDRVAWIAADAAYHAEAKYERLRKDATRMNEIERLITPLRMQYQAMWKRGDIDGMRALRIAVEVALTRRGEE